MSAVTEQERPPKVLVGTSGFSYPDWKGSFYPEKISNRDMLAYYAGAFPAVEINSTYYAIPRPQNMEAMVRKTEGKLEFVVKAHQDLTHQREKMDEALPRFMEAIQPLRERGVLGCVLLQFPFSFRHNGQNRDYLASLRERMGEIPVVAEFRNRWWVQESVFEFMRRKGIGYCCVDEPALPGLPPPEVQATSPIGYIRFHGRNKEKWWKHDKAQERYDYEYTESELKEWSGRIPGLLELVVKLYIFFNNHPRGQAVRNARMMASLITALL